jgi:hypothetical protein
MPSFQVHEDQGESSAYRERAEFQPPSVGGAQPGGDQLGERDSRSRLPADELAKFSARNDPGEHWIQSADRSRPGVPVEAGHFPDKVTGTPDPEDNRVTIVRRTRRLHASADEEQNVIGAVALTQ